jgi:hypothetical protein
VQPNSLQWLTCAPLGAICILTRSSPCRPTNLSSAWSVAAVRRPGLPSESNSADLLGAWRRSTPARIAIAVRAAAAKYG